MDGTTTTTDPTYDRLMKEIALRTFADRYLDQNEEREVLQIAGQLGVPVESATDLIAKACGESGIVREVNVRESIRGQLANIPGKIDQNTYERVISTTQPSVHHALNERDVRRLVVSCMEEANRSNVKRGWFSNWYADQKRDLGVL